MSDKLTRALHEAQHGDLRPQLNRHAPVNTPFAEIQPILIDRLLQLARPIADASRGAAGGGALQSAAPFFYLIEALKRAGYGQLEQTLCVVLDEFTELEERSYDELYLWCLVELSRTDARHVDTYWPLAMKLDVCHRGEPWRRTEGVCPAEQPYLLSELLFYYYFLYSLHRRHAYDHPDTLRRHLISVSGPPTLGAHLQRLRSGLDSGQLATARLALESLIRAEPHRPAFKDALGLLPTILAAKKPS